MNSTVKKILNIAEKVLSWILVAFTVCMVIFTIITVTTVDKDDQNIFGYQFRIVLSDSMSKSENNKDMKVHFSAGDIIIVDMLEPEEKRKLQEGDIVTFWSYEHNGFVTHMIRSVEKDSNGRLKGYVTFGTNTGVNDEALLEPDWATATYVGKIPFIGHFFSFLKTTPGYIICILIPFLLLILYNLANVIKLFRKYKKEQTDAIAAERQQIEDERAENQRMMAELLELKAQLMKNNAAGETPEAEKPENSGENEEIAEKTSEEISENQSENAD